MKTLITLLFVLVTGSAYASGVSAMNCIGTTIVYNDEGTSTVTKTELKKIEGDKEYSVYYGESDVFKFYADHDEEAKVISLEILDKQDTLVITNPRMQVARFSVSVGGYWKTYFASLVCAQKN